MAQYPAPPAYAWDWLARNRALWREVHRRVVSTATPAMAERYAAAGTRAEVVQLLRADYPRDPALRAEVDDAVARIAFLGRLDRPFAALGITAPPRGMRWWWSALTGETLEPIATPRITRDAGRQLTLEQVLEGYGDR